MRRPIIAVALAVALVASAFAVGCSGQQQQQQGSGEQQGGGDNVGSVSVIGVWGGTELSSFRKVAAGWEEESGGTMRFEGTRDLSAILRARVQGGNPPDIAILPNPALMSSFGTQLKPLNQMVDMTQLRQDYSQQWIEQGTVNGKFVGLIVKGAPKSTVWYDPKRFEASNYSTPTTYADLESLTDRMREAGDVAPWSIGLEQGGASGWPGSDWIQEIYLAENGPDKYDQWVKHEIPWTDPTVKAAFEKFGTFATTEGNVPGGAQAIVSTGPEDASYLPFQDPPRAYMYFLGAFTQGFIEAQFPDLQPGEDYDFFDFPTINSQYKSPATVGGDTIVVFNDNASTRSFMRYMQKGASWKPWVDAGGFTTPNKSVAASSYPDPIAQKVAEQLTTADPVRFDADDLMPAEVQTAYFAGIIDYVQNPENLDQILERIESTAADAYANQQQ